MMSDLEEITTKPEYYKSAIDFETARVNLQKFHEDLTRDSHPFSSWSDLWNNRQYRMRWLSVSALGTLSVGTLILMLFSLFQVPGSFLISGLTSLGLSLPIILIGSKSNVKLNSEYSKQINDLREAAESFANRYPSLKAVQAEYAVEEDNSTRKMLSEMFYEKLFELTAEDKKLVRSRVARKTSLPSLIEQSSDNLFENTSKNFSKVQASFDNIQDALRR